MSPSKLFVEACRKIAENIFMIYLFYNEYNDISIIILYINIIMIKY